MSQETAPTTPSVPAVDRAAHGSALPIVARCDTCGQDYVYMNPRINTHPCPHLMCRGIIHRLDWVVKKVKKDGQFIERLKPGGEPVFTDNIIKALRFSEATAKIYRDCGGGFEMEKLNAPDETTPDLTT